jgi:hypothetical protein
VRTKHNHICHGIYLCITRTICPNRFLPALHTRGSTIMLLPRRYSFRQRRPLRHRRCIMLRC